MLFSIFDVLRFFEALQMLFFKFILTLSWRRSLSYRNQSIDLLGKSIDWFLYDNGLRRERVKKLRVLATKNFKTINDIRPNNTEVRYYETTICSDESLNIFGQKIWNHQPPNIQSGTSLTKFKEYINAWFRPKSKYTRMIDFGYYHLFFMYLLYVFLLGLFPFFMIFTFHFCSLWFSNFEE